MARPARPHWWALITVLVGVADSTVAAVGDRRRFLALTERLYAAITVHAAEVWLTAATAIGRSAPASASRRNQRGYLAGVVVGAPGTAREVRIERKLHAWPDIAKAIELIRS